MRTGDGWWLGLLVLAMPACGSSSGGTPFTPTTPIADVCSLLALSDVQMLIPDAPAGTPLAPDDNADVWSHGCAWQASPTALTLLVQGALTRNGVPVIDFAVNIKSDSTTQATPIAGVGDQAVYLVNQGLGQILNARQGNEVVSLSVSGFPSDVPASSLQPLAVEALARL